MLNTDSGMQARNDNGDGLPMTTRKKSRTSSSLMRYQSLCCQQDVRSVCWLPVGQRTALSRALQHPLHVHGRWCVVSGPLPTLKWTTLLVPDRSDELLQLPWSHRWRECHVHHLVTQREGEQGGTMIACTRCL